MMSPTKRGSDMAGLFEALPEYSVSHEVQVHVEE